MALAQKNTLQTELLFSRFANELSPFLEEAGLGTSFFTDPELEVSAASLVKLMELAGRSLGDNIGLRLGSQVQSSDMGVLGQALRSMDRLGDTFKGLSRYMVTRSQAERIEFVESDRQVVVSYQIADPSITQKRQDAEFSIAAMLSCMREMTGCAITPVRVDFEHAAPGDLSCHREMFHCPIRFGQDCNRLYFNRSILDLPICTSNRRLLQALQPYLEEQRKIRSQSASLLIDVSRAIATELGRGRIGVVQVAEAMNLSVRTLQRRLRDLDLEFGTVVEDVRRALAIEYVGNSSFRLTDVALMLGYTEASSFSRAFRRWTNLTPREYRKTSGLP
ncbi:AraC-like transcriptional regulator QhpR [Pseudomonas sp. XS1P51]